MHVVVIPEIRDVIVTTDLFGDILLGDMLSDIRLGKGRA